MTLSKALATGLLALIPLSTPALAGPIPIAGDEAAGAGLTPQHDPSCFEVYSAIGSGTLYYYPDAYAIFDDAHTTQTGDAPLCAFTLVGRNFEAGPQSIFVSFHAGDAADGVPGALTAGPFEVVFPVAGSTQTIHFEAPSGYVTPNVWIKFEWPAGTGLLAIRGSTGASIGSTHDVLYDPQTAAFDDWGATFAGFNSIVYTSPPVPAQTATWGAVKAIYR